jgi:hypothetical protein
VRDLAETCIGLVRHRPFVRPTLDETGAAAVATIASLIRWHRGRFSYGVEEPVS